MRRTLESAYQQQHCFRVFAAVLKNPRQVVEDFGRFWLDRPGAAQTYLRGIEVPEATQHGAQAAVRRRMVRAKPDCPAQAGGGLVGPPLGHRKYSEIEVGVGVVHRLSQ